ncbi:hypothetical protein RAA17_14250 [Komagataeibacter rhaeticus]|nr:hypothetical protein [Komagataeibacter rhaeticus]
MRHGRVGADGAQALAIAQAGADFIGQPAAVGPTPGDGPAGSGIAALRCVVMPLWKGCMEKSCRQQINRAMAGCIPRQYAGKMNNRLWVRPCLGTAALPEVLWKKLYQKLSYDCRMFPGFPARPGK